MSVVDIVIIALVVLFGAFGALRGVQKSALSFGAFLVSFILAFFLAKVVAEALLGIVAVKDFVIGTEGFSLYTSLNILIPSNAGLGESFLDKNFYAPMLEVVRGFNGLQPAFTEHNALAMCAAFVIFTAICGVGVYIVARLLMCLVTMIVKAFIDKKKSWLNRLFGFLIGVVRGLAWGFVITLVFSMVGGIRLVAEVEGDAEAANSAIAIVRMAEGDELGGEESGETPSEETPEEGGENEGGETPEEGGESPSPAQKAKDAFVWLNNEYETSVLGKYFNEFAYTVRNKLLLPEPDMFERIVYKSGVITKPEDIIPSYNMAGDALDIYVTIMNLNYIDDEYTVVDGKLSVGEGAADKLIRPQDFSHTGFSDIVTAVMAYNVSAGEKIRLGALDAEKETVSAELLEAYGIAAETISEKWFDFKIKLTNYENYIADDCTHITLDDDKRVANQELKQRYDALVGVLNDIKAQYNEIKSLLGELELDANPPVYQLEVEEAAE